MLNCDLSEEPREELFSPDLIKKAVINTLIKP